MPNFFMEQFMKIYQNFFFHLKAKIEKNDNYLDKRIKIDLQEKIFTFHVFKRSNRLALQSNLLMKEK